MASVLLKLTLVWHHTNLITKVVLTTLYSCANGSRFRWYVLINYRAQPSVSRSINKHRVVIELAIEDMLISVGHSVVPHDTVCGRELL